MAAFEPQARYTGSEGAFKPVFGAGVAESRLEANRVAYREFTEGIAFRDFAALAKLQGWTAEELAREFPGVNSPEPSVAYFTRVIQGRPNPDVAIPYRRIIEKYLREARMLIAAGKLRSCGCGCGSPLFYSQQRFAHDHDKNGVGAEVIEVLNHG